MPIEFRCHQCNKLLRVGDETAGKQAKCPSCGVVQQIPAASSPATEPSMPPFSPAAATGGSPFGAALPPQTPPAGEQNPYQSPPSYPGQQAYEHPGGGAREPYRCTPIDIGDVLTRSWEIYKTQMALVIGGVVICGLINYAAQMAVNFLNMGLQAAQVNEIAIIAVNVMMIIMQVLFQSWIGIGQTMLLLRIAKGESASLGTIFEGGRYLVRTILASLLFGLIGFAVVIVCAIPAGAAYLATKEPGVGIAVFIACYIFPAAYLGLTFMQYFYLIVDHDLGAVESLTASREITRGNKLSIFAILLIGMLLYFAGVLACCVGAIFTGPYVMLSLAVMYLCMSGGATASPFRR